MKYVSTRGQTEPVSFTEAVQTGLAPDGGLFLPEDLPDFSARLADWSRLSYADLCLEFFQAFATDLPADALAARVADSYSRFDHPEIAPLRRLDNGLHLLELFHGPTLAFKDFALQLLGNLYEEQIARTGTPINVLGATSGDTGSAAIHGLLGREGVHIFILYPKGRTSRLQERQMTCTGAANVFPLAIEGSFDDAQAALKEVFADQSFRTKYSLSAVNSINIARVLAQCVYYFYAWLRLPEGEREEVTFVVPTGNFGNVLAGWLAGRMGLPATGFRIATNRNDILHRLFRTGKYEIGDVWPSLAPSMDIQVASNFERFLYYALEGDVDAVRVAMKQIKDKGAFAFEKFDRSNFSTMRTGDEEIPLLVRRVYEQYGTIVDPHTACGFNQLPEKGTRIVLATAHPAKFPETIDEAIGIEVTHPRLEELKSRERVHHTVEANPAAIAAFIAEHAARG